MWKVGKWLRKIEKNDLGNALSGRSFRKFANGELDGRLVKSYKWQLKSLLCQVVVAFGNACFEYVTICFYQWTDR